MLLLNSSTAFVLALLPLAGGSAVIKTGDDGANWPQFRGPGGLCVADDTPIPTDFGPDKRVLWKTEVPKGHSSPVIWGQQVIVTGYESGTNIILSLDWSSGELIWDFGIEGSSLEDVEYPHTDAAPGQPTPCTDGKRIIAYFANYGLVAFSMEGEVLWERELPYPGYAFGVANSPILVGERVILTRDGAPETAIMAFDAATGEDAWKIDRFDYGESHGSPFLWRNADREELIISGTRRVCSYDPATGESLWTYDGITVFPCTTAVGDADTLYFAAWSTSNATGRSLMEGTFGRSIKLSDAEIGNPRLFFERLDLDGDGHVKGEEVPESRAKDAFSFVDTNGNGSWEVEEFMSFSELDERPGKNIMVAIKRGGKGDIDASGLRWTWRRGLPYVASPLLYRGRIWLFKSGGIATCLDAETGKAIFDRERLGDNSEYYLSPVGAAGHVIAGAVEGTMVVLKATADELEVVHSVHFEDGLFGTPAVLDGKIFMRTSTTMYAFGL
ncbi:MAG: outer membrane protein assembly factor BamB [Planctomycetota bacterium]|jgi:outer membrane protein assembly factor BamB